MEPKPHILIVDSERELARSLALRLEQEGLSAQHVESGARALEAAESSSPAIELILLDMKLPDLPGTEVYWKLRALDRMGSIPFMFATASDQELERIVALELGADDCVTKPYRVRETALRMRALLRRFAACQAAVGAARLNLDGLSVDVDAHEVWVDGREVELTALEFRLLQALVSRRGRVQSRTQLLQDVWSMNAQVTTRTVDTHIKRLREKLGPAAAYVETIRGIGYRFERGAATTHGTMKPYSTSSDERSRAAVHYGRPIQTADFH